MFLLSWIFYFMFKCYRLYAIRNVESHYMKYDNYSLWYNNNACESKNKPSPCTPSSDYRKHGSSLHSLTEKLKKNETFEELDFEDVLEEGHKRCQQIFSDLMEKQFKRLNCEPKYTSEFDQCDSNGNFDTDEMNPEPGSKDALRNEFSSDLPIVHDKLRTSLPQLTSKETGECNPFSNDVMDSSSQCFSNELAYLNNYVKDVLATRKNEIKNEELGIANPIKDEHSKIQKEIYVDPEFKDTANKISMKTKQGKKRSRIVQEENQSIMVQLQEIKSAVFNLKDEMKNELLDIRKELRNVVMQLKSEEKNKILLGYASGNQEKQEIEIETRGKRRKEKEYHELSSAKNVKSDIQKQSKLVPQTIENMWKLSKNVNLENKGSRRCTGSSLKYQMVGKEVNAVHERENKILEKSVGRNFKTSKIKERGFAKKSFLGNLEKSDMKEDKNLEKDRNIDCKETGANHGYVYDYGDFQTHRKAARTEDETVKGDEKMIFRQTRPVTGISGLLKRPGYDYGDVQKHSEDNDIITEMLESYGAGRATGTANGSYDISDAFNSLDESTRIYGNNERTYGYGSFQNLREAKTQVIETPTDLENLKKPAREIYSTCSSATLSNLHESQENINKDVTVPEVFHGHVYDHDDFQKLRETKDYIIKELIASSSLQRAIRKEIREKSIRQGRGGDR